MCTVTFLPQGKNGFILTSNRDESIERASALPVKEYFLDNKKLYFPKDQHANGTWIVSEINGYTLCLLNGGFEKHESKPPYKKSRGLMVLDFYSHENVIDFVNHYDFDGIEPFTLIFVYACPKNNKRYLHELRWNGQLTTLSHLDASLPHIWSSATLYTKEVIEARKTWFDAWIQNNKNYTSEDILFFHHFGGNGSQQNDLIMNRASKKTVSITCFNKNDHHTDIIYEDLVNQKRYQTKVINDDEDSASTC